MELELQPKLVENGGIDCSRAYLRISRVTDEGAHIKFTALVDPIKAVLRSSVYVTLPEVRPTSINAEGVGYVWAKGFDMLWVDARDSLSIQIRSHVLPSVHTDEIFGCLIFNHGRGYNEIAFAGLLSADLLGSIDRNARASTDKYESSAGYTHTKCTIYIAFLRSAQWLSWGNRHRGNTGLDLRDYLRVLRRNWILIVATTLIGLLTGGTASVLTEPTYTAETELFVAIQSSGSVLELQQGNTFSQARVQSYVKTVDSPAVLQPAIDSLGLSVTAEDLAKQVKASSDVNTVLINISVSDHSPVQAAAIAEAISTSLIKTVDSLEKPKTGGTSPVGLSVIKPAKAPSTPSAPSTRTNLLIGLLVGLALGVAVAILRTTLDNHIRSEADLRKVTDFPLLGGITFDQDAAKKPLLTQSAPQSPRAESFRQLRTNLQFANVAGHAKTVLVTSSIPGEGKSTTAANLAIALAQSGQSVCLVDADLRRPMVNEYLGLDRTAGLTTALVGAADVNELLQQWGEDNLYVLASGQVPPNPSELLGSEEMRNLILRLEDAFDAVVIDTPPLLPVTDAAVLAQHVGGVVVVVGSHRLRQHDLQKSLAALAMVSSNVLGIVMNRLPVKGPDSYAYSQYSYEQTDQSKTPEPRSTSRRPRRMAGDAAPGNSIDPADTRNGERPASLFPADRVGRP